MSKLPAMFVARYRFFFLLSMLLLASVSVYSQRNCGHDSWAASMQQHPQLLKEIQLNQQKARQFINNSKSLPCGPGNTLVIPMAFHFSGSITNANMTCIMNTINDQIQVLNEDFGGYNTDITTYCNHATQCPSDYAPTALGNDACIQFCLATQNLPGGASDAITFGQYVWSSPAIAAPGWDGIFNVFISDVDPPNTPSNLLGVAPISGAANPNGNGMFVTAAAFGGKGNTCVSGISLNNSATYNQGRTGTHEAGHYFGLEHTFHTQLNGTPCIDGDGIADTPDQSQDNAFSPTIDYNNCTSTAINSCGTQDFFFNYMDYVDDAAMFMFTADQMAVMKATGDMGTWAANTVTCGSMDHTPLLPVGGCPVNMPPTSAFTQDYMGSPLCAAVATIQFTDASQGFPTGWSWTFSGAGVSPTSSTDANPQVTYNASGTITATLVASNNAGNGNMASQSIAVTIEDPSNCGDCNTIFTDDGGSNNNYPPQDATYLICAASTSDVVQLNFSSIGLPSLQGSLASTDHLEIYEGNTATGSPVRYAFGNSLTELIGNTYITASPVFTASTSCVTVVFDHVSGSEPGWVANVNCLPAPTCNDGYLNQGETFVDCGGPCTPCPDFCDDFSFTDAGGINNPTGLEGQTWQICAEDMNDQVTLTFNTIDMQPFNNGILFIHDDDTNNAPNFDYYVTSTAIFIPAGGNNLNTLGSNTIVSTDDCLTFEFWVPPGSLGDGNGWEATVECPTSCAQTSVVTTLANSGVGSLRAAIDNTCKDGMITFATNTNGGPVTLTSSGIVVNKDLVLSGNGVNTTILDGNNAHQFFSIQAGASLQLDNMTLRDGFAPQNGGAFYNLGDVILDNCILEGNAEGIDSKAFTNRGPATVTIKQGSTVTIK